MLSQMNHEPVSRLLGEILITSYVDNTTLMIESEEELRSLLMRVKDVSEKAGLILSIKKLRSWHPVPLLHGN